MAANPSVAVPDNIKALAAIGNVCLQYSLLELMVAGISWELLDLDMDQGAIVTGGADLTPRINIALNLMEELGAPLHMKKRLRAIRTELQDRKLIDRRNQVVHGAQKATGIVTTFTMLRWGKSRRHEEIHVNDILDLGHDFSRLSQEAAALVDDAMRWREKKHGTKDG